MGGHYAKDLTGNIYGFYKVIERAPNYYQPKDTEKKNPIAMWLCECMECGNRRVVRGQHLKSGKIISDRCYMKQRVKETLTKHNGSNTRLYVVWEGMRNRCGNKNIRSYKDYGARGIYVCDEWRDNFATFQKWAYENGYNENAEHMQCQIDRIDNNGPYAPWNCRFVTAKDNANNRRPMPSYAKEAITVFNLTLPRYKWANYLNISPYKIKSRPDKLGVEATIFVLNTLERRMMKAKQLVKSAHFDAEKATEETIRIGKEMGLDKLSSEEFIKMLESLAKTQGGNDVSTV